MKALALLFIFIAKPAFANPACAVCTVAMGAFLGVSRMLGVNDNSVGVWIGALLLMTYYWSIQFVEKKQWTFRYYKAFWLVMTLILVPVMYKFVVWNMSTIFGIDSFLISMFSGAAVFALSQIWYQKAKAKNAGHAHFPFEKVVVAIVSLLIVSIIFNYV